VQGVVDRQVIRQDLCVEIRSRWPTAPTFHPELQRLGFRLLEQSRLICIESTNDRLAVPALDAARLAVLFDPLAEEAWLTTNSAEEGSLFLDVFCRPGVTDAEGETAARALPWRAGLTATIESRRYCAVGLVIATVSREWLHPISDQRSSDCWEIH
jgi:hypothetical protein